MSTIRNICLLGHSGSGKTALAESLLYMTGAIDRMGKNADGNTVCDYDPEEIRRNISISTSVVPVNYKNVKFNILDTPGGFDFSGAVVEALRAADAAVLVASAKDGITVGFEKAWKYCEARKMPRFVYISKLDEDNSDFNATLDALREKYGNKIAPIVIPLLGGGKVTGLIDVLTRKTYSIQNFKRVDMALPAEKEAVVDEFTEALKESVAETDEALMDKFFAEEPFTYEEMVGGLKQGV
ncbi:MAG: GTP-binding protein, partial [Oscillospiraceae bacterium]|nr:GTP-binding protein [Oscillospiraceae bacterium]